MQVASFMKREFVVVSPYASLVEAARLMWDHDTGFLPVVATGGELVGVLTDRDALMASYTTGRALSEIEVGWAMNKEVKTCTPETIIEDAEQIMGEHQIRRLPVIDKGALVGVLSINDLARAAATQGNELLEQEIGVALGAINRPREAVH